MTLTTDFGTRDGYVAEMKGVILALAREVQLVDLTHEIAPQAVREGALALAAAALFPPGTIHLAVVDPGVGTPRRGVVVSAGGQLYVGPDNGLLTLALQTGGWQAFEIAAAGLRRPTVSRTFHGRDVFAPAAAHLALGVAASAFGPPVTDPVRLHWPAARRRAGHVEGEVIHVDRFGNLVTSITAGDVEALVGPRQVRIRGATVPLVGVYADLAPRRAGALIGSRGRLEIAVRDGSAWARFRARPGSPVVLCSRRGIGVPAETAASALSRTTKGWTTRRPPTRRRPEP